MVSPVSGKDEDAIFQNIQRLKDGCVLLSSENLLDPNFQLTVVLICVHNNEGAFGLVCNRPSHMPLSEIFSNTESFILSQKRKIYIGGPVQQESLHILQITDKAAENAYMIYPRVYLGGEWESLDAILQEDPVTTRLFLGYSGWEVGQLESEIAEGAWDVYTVNCEKFLMQWEEPLFYDIEKIRSYLKGISL